ncbi:flagellar protein FlaG [Pseudalkalibacillus berkeleyi]|uniref:Flagellar protein FlaG n=1 Tax=Pseudalkalibacillus berkeleyi TaxID=1069813 RepID=A0ABS9H3R6_9BACL|nr:flagellar protein FlaG [Pseudalkalibacillus berkeleyi]MCF6138751.1 flagellar protein FlaG [Pseudalkalibacillus berkeleyi]
METGNVSSSTSGVQHLERIIGLKFKGDEQESKKKKEDNSEEQSIPKAVLDEKIASMNEFLMPTHTSLKFQLHEQSDEYYVQVVDDQTNEVVREIPDRKFLDMYAAMAELVGIVVDEKI